MKAKPFVCAAFLLLFALAALTRLTAAEIKRPNIVIFLADDAGWGDYSHSGNTQVRTPNIDSIARDGASLDRFFVCAVCAPTRAEFFTGRYHPRGGVRGVSTGQERLNTDEKTMGDTFKAAGYATSAFGKWHPELHFARGERPVVQVIAAGSGEILYTVRAPASRFRPPVFGAGPYRIKVGANRPDGLDFGPSDPAPQKGESRDPHPAVNLQTMNMRTRR